MTSPDPEKRTLEEIAEEAGIQAAGVLGRVLKVFDEELQRQGINLDDIDALAQEARAAQEKRRAQMDVEHEQRRRRLDRKWRRY